MSHVCRGVSLCIWWIFLLVCRACELTSEFEKGGVQKKKSFLFLTLPLFPCPYACGSSGPAAWRLGWPVQGLNILWGPWAQGVAHFCLWITLDCSHGEGANKWNCTTECDGAEFRLYPVILWPEVTQWLCAICVYLGFYSSYQHLWQSTCWVDESSCGIQLHLWVLRYTELCGTLTEKELRLRV